MASPYFVGNMESFHDYGWNPALVEEGVAYVHTRRSCVEEALPGFYNHPREFRLMGVLEHGLEGLHCSIERLVHVHPTASLVVGDEYPDLLRRQLDVMAVCCGMQRTCPQKSEYYTANFMDGHRVNLIFPKLFEVRTCIIL